MAVFATTYMRWSVLDMPFGPTQFSNVTYSEGAWYVLGRTAAGAMSVYRSGDAGASWSLYDDTLPTQDMPTWGNAFVVAQGWYAIGGAGGVRYFSPNNGVFSWGSVAPAGAGTPDTKVAFVGGVFVVYNSNGMLVGKALDAGMQAVARPATAVAYDGSGTFFCAGTDGKIYTSPDCLTWTMNAFSGELNSQPANFSYLVKVEGVWYGGLPNLNNTYSSTDLVTWSGAVAGAATAATYANGLLVLSGAQGFMTAKPLPDSFATENPPAFASTDASVGGGVSYGGGVWMISNGAEVAVSIYQGQPGFNRQFGGTVTDSSGSPAARRVSILRADHTLIASTVSCATDGSWSLLSCHQGETIALISGEPAKNALVFERITPP